MELDQTRDQHLIRLFFFNWCTSCGILHGEAGGANQPGTGWHIPNGTLQSQEKGQLLLTADSQWHYHAFYPVTMDSLTTYTALQLCEGFQPLAANEAKC